MQDSSGFSLFELLVVIAIILLITFSTGISLGTFGVSTRTSAVSEDILTLVRETRQMSLAVKEFKTTGVFPNYGLYFDMATPSQIIVYADCKSDDDNSTNLDEADNFIYNPASPTCPGGSDLVKTFQLQQPIVIRAIRTLPQGVITPQGRIYVEFVRPEPTTWITDASNGLLGNPGNGTVEIDIGDTGGKFKQTLIMGTNGKIELK